MDKDEGPDSTVTYALIPHFLCQLREQSLSSDATEKPLQFFLSNWNLGNRVRMGMEKRIEQERTDEARAFHSQLRQLIAAKIPICLDPRNGGTSAQSMESLHSRFESHLVNHGTIESYLSESALPAGYRIAMRQWIQGSPLEALDRLTVGAEGQRFFKNAVGFVFLQASLILGTVFLGMACICIFLLPKLKRLQADSFVEPGPGLRMLTLLRDTLPLWGSLIPLLACIVLLFHRSLFGRLMARMAPMQEDSHALSEFQCLFSRPACFQWMVSLVVIVCGGCVLLQALSVLGVSIELFMQLVTS